MRARAAVALLVGLGTAGPVLAQSNRGGIALDALVAPTTGLGFGYYVTDGLSLRPWLGIGYSDYQGLYADVGAQLRYELATGWTVSPYLSASALYSHREAAAIAEPARPRARSDQELVLQGSGGRFGTGAGLRIRVTREVSLIAEGRVIYASYPIGELRRGWSSFEIGDRSYGEVVLGVSYLLR